VDSCLEVEKEGKPMDMSTDALRRVLERRGVLFSGPRELLLFRLARMEKEKFVPRCVQVRICFVLSAESSLLKDENRQFVEPTPAPYLKVGLRVSVFFF